MVSGGGDGSYIEGTVERVSGNGFRLAGRETWLNLSKYATPRPELPPIGAVVRVSLDRSSYVRGIDIIEGPPALELEGAGPVPSVDRDRRIMRQAVLNSAIEVLATQGPVDPDAALRLAERFELWVLRDD